MNLNKLSNMQTAVLDVPEAFNIALLGGRGGGKTIGALMLVVQHVQRYEENASVLIVRQTLRALSEFEDELLEIISALTNGVYSYNKSEKILRVGGASITLAAIEDQRSYNKLQGKSFTFLVVEEVTQFAKEKLLRMLRSNLRGPIGVPCRVLYLGNPGGPLHGLIYERHIKGQTPFKPYEIDLGEGFSETWVTVPSTLRDNPFIPHSEYMLKLRSACHGDPAKLAQWLEGAWEEGAGLLFPTYDPLVHNLERAPNFLIDPDIWIPRFAIDWGLSSPSVALLGIRNKRQIDFMPKGSLWVCAEVTDAIMDDDMDLSTSKEWPPSRLAERVLKRGADLGVRRAVGVVDSARGLQGEELSKEMQREGFWSLTRPRKGRRAEGWALVNSMLQATQERDPIRPHIYFSPDCHYLLTTIARAQRDESDPDDWLDSPSCPDHAGDALRYLINEQRVQPATSGKVIGYY